MVSNIHRKIFNVVLLNGYVGQILITFREKLVSAFIWNALNSLSQQGAVLVSSIILANILGLKDFGIFSLLISTTTMISNFAQGGTGIVATKFVAENFTRDPKKVGRIIGLCKIISAATSFLAITTLIIFANQISVLIVDNQMLANNLRLVAIAIFFQVIIVYQIGALQGFGEFKQISKVGGFSGISYLLLLTTGGWLGGLEGALSGFIVANALRSILCWYYLQVTCIKHNTPITHKIYLEDIKLVWYIGLPAGLAGLITIPAMWVVNVALSKLPDGFELVSFYAIGHQIRQATLQLPSLLNSVTFSVLSRMKNIESQAEFKKVFLVNLISNTIYSILIAGIIFLGADQLLKLWAVNNKESIIFVQILAISLIPEIIAMCFYQFIQTAGKMWTSLFLISIPRDGIYLLSSLYYLPLYGLAAIAYTYLGAQLVSLFLTLIIKKNHSWEK